MWKRPSKRPPTASPRASAASRDTQSTAKADDIPSRVREPRRSDTSETGSAQVRWRASVHSTPPAGGGEGPCKPQPVAKPPVRGHTTNHAESGTPSARYRYTVARDSQHFLDVAGRDALLPELTGFGGIGVVHLAGAPALASVGTRR